jgi:hypothetical protein
MILMKNMCYKGRAEYSNDSCVEWGLDLESSARRAGVLFQTALRPPNYDTVTLQLELSYMTSGVSN